MSVPTLRQYRLLISQLDKFTSSLPFSRSNDVSVGFEELCCDYNSHSLQIHTLMRYFYSDISHNDIDELPSSTFDGLSSLQYLFAAERHLHFHHIVWLLLGYVCVRCRKCSSCIDMHQSRLVLRCIDTFLARSLDNNQLTSVPTGSFASLTLLFFLFDDC